MVGDSMTAAIAATFALAAALLAVVVRIKWVDQRHADFVDDSHVPLHQEDR